MLKQLLQKHTLAVAGAAVVLLAAAATVGAAAGVSGVAGNVGDVLDALPIVSGSSTVEICHVPSDDPDDPETISVEEGDVEEHLAHGDTEGACVEAEPEETTDDLAPADSIEICHVPTGNPDNAHTIFVEEGELEEHLAHGDIEGACDESSSPEPEPPEDLGPVDKVEICHVPEGNPDNAHTITIGEPAVDDHLTHGDLTGACEDESSPGAPDSTGPADKVEVCHNAHTLSLTENAAAQHVAHGDTEGPCENESSPGAPDSTGPADKVEVCHNARTLSLSETAAAQHLAHGDTEGACDEE